jgi:hypothetical protein
MPRQFELSDGQIADFETVRALGPKNLEAILKKLKAAKHPPLSQPALRRVMGEALSSKDEADRSASSNALSRVILGLGSVYVRELDDLERILASVDESLREFWSSDKAKLTEWEKARPLFAELLKLDSVRTTMKAVDVSYEYANILMDSRIMTDIRPIFNETGDQIQGAVVAFTLRLNFINADDSHSISIAVDAADLQVLLEQCNRALLKAKTASQRLSSKSVGIPSTIAGIGAQS